MSDQEQAFYEIATREVAERNFVAGVYGKAFSQAWGDAQVALALYIKLRVEQLSREAGEFAQQEQQRELQRQKEARRLAGQPEPQTHAQVLLGCAFAIVVLGSLFWSIPTLLSYFKVK